MGCTISVAFLGTGLEHWRVLAAKGEDPTLYILLVAGSIPVLLGSLLGLVSRQRLRVGGQPAVLHTHTFPLGSRKQRDIEPSSSIRVELKPGQKGGDFATSGGWLYCRLLLLEGSRQTVLYQELAMSPGRPTQTVWEDVHTAGEHLAACMGAALEVEEDVGQVIRVLPPPAPENNTSTTEVDLSRGAAHGCLLLICGLALLVLSIPVAKDTSLTIGGGVVTAGLFLIGRIPYLWARVVRVHFDLDTRKATLIEGWRWRPRRRFFMLDSQVRLVLTGGTKKRRHASHWVWLGIGDVHVPMPEATGNFLNAGRRIEVAMAGATRFSQKLQIPIQLTGVRTCEAEEQMQRPEA
mgnify:CR=1 FL=1